MRAELITLALRGFAPLALLSGICLVSATTLVAAWYGDRFLWWMVAFTSIISAARIASVVTFPLQTGKLTGTPGTVWSVAFGVLTFLFCASIATLTLYNFRFHGEGSRIVCVMGTFTICSGISSRIGLQPRLSQACVIMMQACLGFSAACSKDPLVRFGVILTAVTAYAYCTSIRNQHDVMREQICTRRRLRRLANRDSLTGLANRHHFETRLREASESGTPFTLFMIDLDGFKNVNDTYGHAGGDEILIQVARRLERVIRSNDLLARLGGDEFVILQTEPHTVKTARRLAERIQHEISVPFDLAGRPILIGASTGIKMTKLDEKYPDHALSEADRALYRVKASGQSGYEFV
jgi:diguanylate cyclase (GGDEF)-like protein